MVSLPSMSEIWKRAGVEPELLEGWLIHLAKDDDVHAYEVR